MTIFQRLKGRIKDQSKRKAASREALSLLGYCGPPRSLQGDRTQTLWPRQEVLGPYHCPNRLMVIPLPPGATRPTPSHPTRKGLRPSSPRPYRGRMCPQPTGVCIGPLSPQPVSRSAGASWALASPWAVRTDATTRPGVADPDYREVIPLCQQLLLPQ